MIIDSFSYFNEKELLELRINLLKDYVDKFIIIDANRTHQGKIKPFTCKHTINNLNLNCEKIQVIELDLSWADNETNSWIRERAQRNEISKYINDDAYCIISDCDEIIDPKQIQKAINGINEYDDIILTLPMYYLLYKANIQTTAPWYAAYVAKGSVIKNVTPSYYREKIARGGDVRDWDFKTFVLEPSDGSICGWHFSWMGDNMNYKLKNESFAVHGTLNDSVKDYILSYIPKIGGRDLYNREDHILIEFDTSLLPKIIWDLPNVYNFLFK